MNRCDAGFENGTLAASVLAADAGNSTAWDAVERSPGNDCLYDATHAVYTKSAKFVSAGGGGANWLKWHSSGALGSAMTDYYWRAYVYMEDFPSAVGTADFANASRSSETESCWTIRCTTAGVLEIYDTIGLIGTFTNPMLTDQWVRFEGHVNHASNAIEIKLFYNASSATATETQSLTGSVLRADTETTRFGTGNLNTTYWLDQIVTGATSYPGPVVESSAPQQLQPRRGGTGRW